VPPFAYSPDRSVGRTGPARARTRTTGIRTNGPLESGLNIRQVQLLLGHEDLQTTILYLNYSFEEIGRVAQSVQFSLALNREKPGER
jgi:hypothetical protein